MDPTATKFVILFSASSVLLCTQQSVVCSLTLCLFWGDIRYPKDHSIDHLFPHHLQYPGSPGM